LCRIEGNKCFWNKALKKKEEGKLISEKAGIE
jgi:hypothetical protein